MADLFAVKRENAAYAETAAFLSTQRAPGNLIVIEGPAWLPLTPFLPQGADGPVEAEEFVKKPDRRPDGEARLLRFAGQPAASTNVGATTVR